MLRVSSDPLLEHFDDGYLHSEILQRDSNPVCFVQDVTEKGRVASSLKYYDEPFKDSKYSVPSWPSQTLKEKTDIACLIQGLPSLSQSLNVLKILAALIFIN